MTAPTTTIINAPQGAPSFSLGSVLAFGLPQSFLIVKTVTARPPNNADALSRIPPTMWRFRLVSSMLSRENIKASRKSIQSLLVFLDFVSTATPPSRQTPAIAANIMQVAALNMVSTITPPSQNIKKDGTYHSVISPLFCAWFRISPSTLKSSRKTFS